ncbi:MAG: CHAD domain-containing protein [Verrucomicrobiota bacterium]
MPFILSDQERPGAFLRGVLRGFARVIVENIERLPDDAIVRIHDIRVSTKKIRSLLRLAGPEISVEDHAAVLACLKAIKNTFSASRDDDVMRQRLPQVFSGKRAEQAEKKLGLARTENASPLVAGPASAAATQLSSRIAALNLDGLTPEHLVENATSSYRRARQIMARCKKSPDDDAMHAWRKRVKDVCYHAMAFPATPSLEECVRPVDSLAEWLGEYHDLTLLGGRASDHKKIAARLNAAKHKVGKRCFKAAKSIFRKTPAGFERRLSRMVLSPG